MSEPDHGEETAGKLAEVSDAVVRVHPDPESLAEAAAQALGALLEAAPEPFTLALAGGSTPKRLYRALTRRPELPWSKARIFLGDERALPADHPDSNARMAEESLFAPLELGAAQQRMPDGGARPLEAEADRYAAALCEAAGTPPRLDLVLLGMGGDGHTASLFPGEPEPEGWVAATRAPPDTPSQDRLTLTPDAILAARRVWILVTGAAKAERLSAVMSGQDPGPLARLVARRAGGIEWWIDEAAAAAPQEETT